MVINPQEIKKIGVIQLNHFGDLLMTSGYFHTLKKHFPLASIVVITKRPFDQVLQGHPHIESCITEPKTTGIQYLLNRIATMISVRKAQFDILIDQENLNSTKYILAISGAKWRIGYPGGRFANIYNIALPSVERCYHAQWKYSVISALELPTEPFQLTITITDISRRWVSQWFQQNKVIPSRTILIAPGSTSVPKAWNARGFAEVADYFAREKGFTIVLIGSPTETGTVKTVAEYINSPVLIAPPTTINGAAAFLSVVAGLLCNDCGLNHIAAAVGCRSLAIFGGDSDPIDWSPQGFCPTARHIHNREFSGCDDSFGIAPSTVIEELGLLVEKGIDSSLN